jgi:hypothetical protein
MSRLRRLAWRTVYALEYKCCRRLYALTQWQYRILDRMERRLRILESKEAKGK